ncbi:hypothetical protein GCM10025734_07700 [Kitasatospora paranensis]
MLDRLEKLGYLTRTPHPTDGRKTLVRVTPDAAHRTYALMAPFLDDAGRRVLDRFTPEQLEVVIDFLAFSRGIQQQHTHRLREEAQPGPRRSGGGRRRAPVRPPATGPEPAGVGRRRARGPVRSVACTLIVLIVLPVAASSATTTATVTRPTTWTGGRSSRSRSTAGAW